MLSEEVDSYWVNWELSFECKYAAWGADVGEASAVFCEFA